MTPYLLISWAIVIGFIAVFVVTLLGITRVITFSNPAHLNKLFTVLVLEVIAVGFLIFNDGFAAKNRFSSKAKLHYDTAVALEAEEQFDAALHEVSLIPLINADADAFHISDMFLLKARIYFNRELYNEAAHQYAIYTEIVPNNIDALSHYARALRAVNRFDEAKIIAERAYALDQNHYYVLNNLQNIYRREATFYLDGDRLEAGERLFEKTRQYIQSMKRIAATATEKQRLKMLNADIALAAFNWQWERYPEAIALYELITTTYPEHARAYEDLAAIYLEHGEQNNSPTHIEKALASYTQLYLNAIDDQDKIHMGSGIAEATALLPSPTAEQLEFARNTVSLTIAQNPTATDDPYPHYAAAILYKKLNDMPQATRYIEQAIRYERNRASDPYTFDYKRLVKYELLNNTWQQQAAPAA